MLTYNSEHSCITAPTVAKVLAYAGDVEALDSQGAFAAFIAPVHGKRLSAVRCGAYDD
jgi:hypothetical protein